MEDQERETATEAAQNGLKEDDLELSLGLRPATIRRHFRTSKSTIPAPEGSGDLSLMTVPIWGKGGAGSEQDSEGLGFELEAKKEAQALRRQEARKKREEKRKSKAGNSNERLLWFEKQRALGREKSERESEDDFSERRRKGERNSNGNEVEGVPVPATTSFLVRPPKLNGLSYHMMMPGLVGSDGKAIQPVAAAGSAGGFRPYQLPEKNSGDGGGRGDSVKQSVSGCSRGSSPGVSDHRSTSGQGGSSSDGGSHSSQYHPLEPTINTKPQTAHNSLSLNTKPERTSSCHHTEPIQTEPSPGKKPSQSQSQSQSPSPSAATNEAKGVNQSKPPKPPVQQTNEAMLLSQMPYVSTTGNGPNGKTITGFLYKYSNSEVCIVCVCHGSSFSPAGFIEHAGGVDVEHPLRHITVVPFAFT